MKLIQGDCELGDYKFGGCKIHWNKYAPPETISYVTPAISFPSEFQYLSQYQITTSNSSNWYNALSGQAATGNALFSCGGGMGNTSYYASSGLYGLYDMQRFCPSETAEEKAARHKREAEREAKRKAASLRAENLLFTILTPQQVRQYTDDEYFDVVIDKRTYRIRKGYSRNIELIENGKPIARYCAHPEEAYNAPHADAMLAQLLMLRTNEQEFLRIANRTVLG